MVALGREDLARDLGTAPMTDLDVSLRLRLDNQLSRPAETAEKDLKELQKTIDRIGKSKGGDGLASDLKSAGRSANDATRDIEAMKRQLGNVNSASDGARRSIEQIGTAANNARREINRIGDGAFDGLKADAKAAGDAIDTLGRKTRELNNIPHSNRGIQPGTGGTNGRMSTPHGRPPSGMSTAAGAAYDALGGDGLMVLGAGGAYAVGSAAAGGAVVAGATVKAAAEAEFGSDQLAVLGSYGEGQQAEIEKILLKEGAKSGVGELGAQKVFGGLMGGGLSPDTAVKMTDPALVFAKATQTDLEDIAQMTIALRNNMGITPEQLMAAYDTTAYGGKAGQFETKDMASRFPSLLALMSSKGSSGLEGVRNTTAMAQIIRSVSGSSDQAANAFESMLVDFTSPDVVDRLGKQGIDIFGIMAKARKNGADPTMTVLDTLRKEFGGKENEAKFADTFRNSTSQPAYNAIFDNWDKLQQMIADMGQSKGTVAKDYDRSTGNVNSQFSRFTSHMAAGAKSFAEPMLPFMEAILANINDRLEMTDEQVQASRETLSSNRQGATAAYGAKRSKEGYDWNRILFGAAADPGFSLKDHMAIDLRPTGEEAMVGLNEGIQAQQGAVLAQAQSIADQIKAMFGFTVSPTIQPTFIPPSGGGVVGNPASGKITVNNNISSPNPKAAGRAAVREQNRRIQVAKARSLSSTGRPIQ